MSLINTNHDYLRTMGVSSTSVIVGLIVSVYYLGCAVGAVFFSWFADRFGRKKGIFFCLSTAALGNLIMFCAGLGGLGGARVVMFIGRVIMGLGVGGIDCVIPIYSAELSNNEARGRALAQEFQMNIFGLNMAFAINLGVTRALGKGNQWAWRIPIIVMQLYPLVLLAFIGRLPESPRWCLYNGKQEASKKAMMAISGEGEGEQRFKDLVESQEQESDEAVSYMDMFTPGHAQFHPTMVAIMGQINQVRNFERWTSSHQLTVARHSLDMAPYPSTAPRFLNS
jgi:MFS family permease